MKRTLAAARTVDAYLEMKREAVLNRVSRIRAANREAVPKASEGISYAIAAFKCDTHCSASSPSISHASSQAPWQQPRP